METSPFPAPSRSLLYHQISVLLLTFSAYASFHASRKPPSIVKPALAPDPSSNSTGWPPFDGDGGTHRLGELDLAFLSAYSAGMYLAGHAADRLDLRRFLAIGMLLSGLSCIAFGLGFFWDVHHLLFFIAVQIAGGLVQSIGWPCVVSVVGNWFGFLVVDPRDAGFELATPVSEVEMSDGVGGAGEKPDLGNVEEVGLLEEGSKLDSSSAKAIGFVEAWRLPGVAPFAFCLFFSKLVAYTFLYWLPFYIRHNAVAGLQVSHKTAGMLSTIFDVGGVLGGISAGFISDRLGARAVTSIIFLVCSIPALVIYRMYGNVSMYFNMSLMFLSGYFVNGPYALITTAVAADLGTQDSIKGNSRALATVTAIIDGTGSVGAALGPLLTGYISTRGWNSVFLMLVLATSLAIMFLIRIAKAELQTK
ncbi:hypothetical protein J5N97_027078 [Dioscorea zingiberensis]|uniref:Major facilitator superfamily (MFS) profile domain-containing protein n=1 Tax=Dioscorea zingiberensis TaxID=325984 RepID=A0A9D5H7C7_9LILI|nr:hypothetical protein J5N97_027078 [Dioscorea zingiberensis]